MTDMLHEERITDDMIDAWHERMAGASQIDIDEMEHFCATCGCELTLVRPGKWQCDRCEEPNDE